MPGIFDNLHQGQTTREEVPVCPVIRRSQAFFERTRSGVYYSPPKRTLGGGFKYVLFSPLVGGMIQLDEHIFQMGWFNHQEEQFIISDVSFGT